MVSIHFLKQDYPMKRLLIISLFLFGCGTQTTKTVESLGQQEILDPDLYELHIQTKDNWLSAEYEIDPSHTEGLSASLHGANISAANTAYYNGAPVSPGQAAAGSIIGTLIASSIITNSHKTKMKKEADMPITAFLDNYQSKQGILEAIISTQITSVSMPLEIATQGTIDSSHNGNITPLIIQPTVKITRDYGAIRISLRVYITQDIDNIDTNDFESIYKNTFDYYITPMIDGESVITKSPEFWNNLPDEQLEAYMNEGVRGLLQMLEHDYASFSQAKRKTGHKPIKFTNARGSFYERGNIISSSEGRINFYTLRHTIKSAPGVLTN